MQFLKFVAGLSAVFLAWVVLFRSGIIFKLNAWMRARVFNDELVLFSGRRVAALLLLLGAISIFSGLHDVVQFRAIPEHIAVQMREEAQNDFKSGKYQRVVRRCRELVRSNQKDIVALELLADAYWALGEKEKSRQTAEALLRVDPKNDVQFSAIMTNAVVKSPPVSKTKKGKK